MKYYDIQTSIYIYIDQSEDVVLGPYNNNNNNNNNNNLLQYTDRQTDTEICRFTFMPLIFSLFYLRYTCRYSIKEAASPAPR